MQTLKIKSMRLRKFLYFSSAAVLLVGLSSSIWIYLAAKNKATGDSSYEFIGGFLYPAEGGNTKRYVHDLQLYGGNAAVLADDFMRWFAGLCYGGANLLRTPLASSPQLSPSCFSSLPGVPHPISAVPLTGQGGAGTTDTITPFHTSRRMAFARCADV